MIKIDAILDFKMAPTKNVRGLVAYLLDLSLHVKIDLAGPQQVRRLFHVFVTKSSQTYRSQLKLFMTALRNRCEHYIFVLFLSFFFSSPNLSGRRLDIYHTSTHDVVLV